VEVVVRRGLEAPREHVRVEHVPVATFAHVRARLGSGDDQPLGDQHLDRLAHGRAADVLLVPLAGQRIPGFELTAEDSHTDVVYQRAVQTPTGVAAVFHHTIRRLLDTA